MVYCDYHTHTVFSDGVNTPEEMILESIRRGMPELGISDHSYTAFDERYCIKIELQQAYFDTLRALQKKYANVIRLRIGLEQDYWSEAPVESPEYSIGSVHYVRSHGKYYPVDDSIEAFARAFEQGFGGDVYACCEAYYELVGGVAEKTGCRIIGHFDLVSKFIERKPLFNPEHPRYVAAWQRAAERLLASGCLFEINTGAMTRGYRTDPYPSAPIRRYLKERGARFILSGDSHSASALCNGFERFAGESLSFAPLFIH